MEQLCKAFGREIGGNFYITLHCRYKAGIVKSKMQVRLNSAFTFFVVLVSIRSTTLLKIGFDFWCRRYLFYLVI